MASNGHKPTTREGRRARAKLLVGPFAPKFLDELDQRFAAVQELRRRYQLLVDDVGEPSEAKKCLASRAVFIASQLETMEANALEGQEMALNSYVALVNTLIGILRQLGIERQVRTAGGLNAYMEARAG